MDPHPTVNSAHPKDPPEDAGQNAPAVSVVVPAYNVSPWIAEAVQSVIDQTFRDFEVIVVNDGSPDAAKLHQALAPFQDRITVIDQTNRGPSGARNTGVGRARGEFVAFLDGDDVWNPEFLEKQVGFLRSHPDIDVAYTNAELFGPAVLRGRTLMDLCPSAGEADLEALIVGTCVVFISFSVVRRSALLAVGGFDETMRYAEDFHLWLRLAASGSRIGYSTDAFGRYRLRHGSQSTHLISCDNYIMRALEDIARQPELPESTRQAIAARLDAVWQELRKIEGKIALQRREFGLAHAAFSDASSGEAALKLRAFMPVLRRWPLAALIAWHIWEGVLAVRAQLRRIMRGAGVTRWRF